MWMWQPGWRDPPLSYSRPPGKIRHHIAPPARKGMVVSFQQNIVPGAPKTEVQTHQRRLQSYSLAGSQDPHSGSGTARELQKVELSGSDLGWQLLLTCPWEKLVTASIA